MCSDKPMQLNQSLFMLGGGSGYVPQPDLMRDDAFDPFEKDSLNVEPITIQLQVCSGPEAQRKQFNRSDLFSKCCCLHIFTFALASCFFPVLGAGSPSPA